MKRPDIEQIKLMEHALGNETMYRNYFSTYEGSRDFDKWNWLVENGYAVKRKSPISSDTLFHVTAQGKAVCFQ